MENNLTLHRLISFKELVQHGFDNGANIVNGMPWSWSINGKSITHENDNCYLIETLNGIENFHDGDKLMALENGLKIVSMTFGGSHAPNGCPM